MFGKKRALGIEVGEPELEKKISELEQQLNAERSAHEADKTALQELRGRIKLEEQTFSELQDALRQRIRELDEKTRQYEIEMAKNRKIFLEQDFDISGQFDERLNVLFGNTIMIENTKEDSENSFTLRADAPAKK